ncbi:hypothetical protein C0993_001759 [Termitomyces sp. T159_Od127]|nr:hypothetical protein C0993_001759 [Termitomyces sp. T159_Od127]
MGTKGRATPHVVCCAIPIARAAQKVLVVTSRKRPKNWVCEYPFSKLHSPTSGLHNLAADVSPIPNVIDCSWRLQPRKRPWKKVLPVRLYVSSSPDVFPRSALPFPGVRGTITRFVITIQTPATTYHFYKMDVAALDSDWLEKKERRGEWVDYAEACGRLEWKSDLSQGLQFLSLAPSRSY